MLSSYPVACPHTNCGWTGSLVPSSGADRTRRLCPCTGPGFAARAAGPLPQSMRVSAHRTPKSDFSVPFWPRPSQETCRGRKLRQQPLLPLSL
jgi:hypothetical protein